MMLSNDSVLNNLETVTDNMFYFIKYLITGNYIEYEYEYVFYLNGEELKADDCYSNFYGRTYCELNGVTYNNIEYTKILVNEYEKTNPFIPIFTCGILLILILNLIFKLFFDFGSGDYLDV